jgi:hypothetical protein
MHSQCLTLAAFKRVSVGPCSLAFVSWRFRLLKDAINDFAVSREAALDLTDISQPANVLVMQTLSRKGVRYS